MISIASLMAGCGGVSQTATNPDTPPTSPTAQTASGLVGGGKSQSGISSWAMLTPDALGHDVTQKDIDQAGSGLVILDPASVESVQKPLAKGLSKLRGTGVKRFVATLDISRIGESSPLWKADWTPAKSGTLPAAAPTWLVAANAPNASTFDVRYWDPGWSKAISGECQALLSAGFDGVALTGTDAYRQAQSDRPSAAEDMAVLVEALSTAARARKSDAVVLVANAPLLAERLTDKERPAYFGALDGFVATDVFYGGPKPVNNDLNPNPDLIAALDMADRAGKSVLDWERVSGSDQISAFQARARSRGYLPYAPLSNAADADASSSSPSPKQTGGAADAPASGVLTPAAHS